MSRPLPRRPPRGRLPQVSELPGAVATVLTRIPGPDRPGSVRLVVDGAVDVWLAYADTACERGSRVLVLGVRPGRALAVMPAPEAVWGPVDPTG